MVTRKFSGFLIFFVVTVLFLVANDRIQSITCPGSCSLVGCPSGTWQPAMYANSCGPNSTCCVALPVCPGQCGFTAGNAFDCASKGLVQADNYGYDRFCKQGGANLVCCVVPENCTGRCLKNHTLIAGEAIYTEGNSDCIVNYGADYRCILTYGEEKGIDCSLVENPLVYPVCALREAGKLTTYIMNIGLIAGGLLALWFIFRGAYKIIMARDDPGQLEEGRKMLLYSVAGLIVAASAYVLLRLFSQIVDIPVTFTPSAVYAQEAQTTYQVSGRVTDDVTKATLKGTNIAVYILESGKWKLWSGQSYGNQRNPQSSDEYGEFDFRVPSGTYYLAADSLGYHGTRSNQFTIENAPKRIDIALSAGITFWNILFVVGVGGFCLVVIYILGRMAFVYWKKQQLRQMVLKQAKKSSQDKVANLYPENDPSQSNSPQS